MFSWLLSCKKFVASLLILAILLPSGFVLLQPKPAEAVLGIGDFGFVIDVDKIVRDVILKQLAMAIVRGIIRQMTTSIVNWILTGFQGNPSFITDPAQFFLDVADAELGRLLQSSDLGFLCSPFRLQIVAGLINFNPFRDRVSCTLSKAGQNVENFLQGDFTQGGWNSWFAMMSSPQNTALGAQLQVQQELALRINGKTVAQTKVADWGKGFLSWRDCKSFVGAAGADGVELDLETVDPNDCPIATPGSVIESQLNNQLGSDLRDLELSRAIDEVVNALAFQLVKTVLTEGAGLLGANKGTSARPSALNQYRSTYDQGGGGAVLGGSGFTASSNTDISNENAYKLAKLTSVTELERARNVENQVVACYQRRGGGGDGAALSSFRLSVLNQRINSIQREIDSADAVITSISRTTGTAQAGGGSLDNLLNYQNARQNLHTAIDIQSAQQETANIKTEVAGLVADSQTRLSQCNSGL